MTAKQKAFILDKLIPFILREQGRGFVIDVWRDNVTPGCLLPWAEPPRKAPSCGTIGCIGGSIEVLLGHTEPDPISTLQIEKATGLSPQQQDILFFRWDSLWPNPFAQKLGGAKTPLAQAKVVVALLKEVVRTEGRILDTKVASK
jgi:hypothetical protein